MVVMSIGAYVLWRTPTQFAYGWLRALQDAMATIEVYDGRAPGGRREVRVPACEVQVVDASERI